MNKNYLGKTLVILSDWSNDGLTASEIGNSLRYNDDNVSQESNKQCGSKYAKKLCDMGLAKQEFDKVYYITKIGKNLLMGIGQQLFANSSSLFIENND